MPPQNNPGPASAPSQVGTPIAAMPAWFLADSDWKPGKIIQFAPLGSVPKFVVASDDGTFSWVDLDHARHGEKPPFLPRLATDYTNGVRPHTLKLHQGKWLLARPDGRVLKEYDNNEVGQREAQAHWDKLEPEAAKLKAYPKAEAEPVAALPSRADQVPPLATVKPV